MKEIYFITATNTDVGKTKASEIFLRYLASLSKKVGYLKPIETGVEDKPLDGDKLLTLVQVLNPDFILTLDEVVPFQFKLPAAPFVASNGESLDIEKIFKSIDKALQYCDILIIEGAGGLAVPINLHYFMYDLIKDINPTKTILISPSNLGSINDTLLSMYLLEQKGIKYDWYINLFKDKELFAKTTLPFYNSFFQGNSQATFDKIVYLQDLQKDIRV